MKGTNYLVCLLFLLAGYNSFAQEICDNAKDDDSDGLIDLRDPECQCYFRVPANLLQNASFESFKNCPTNYSYDNDSDIIDNWRYATYTNINDADYYHNFSCAYDSELVMRFLPPSLPLPDGRGFVSIRQYLYRKPGMEETDIAKVYISQCLQTALTPGEQYTLSLAAGRFRSNDDVDFKFKSEPFTVALFGHPDCTAIPFGQQRAYSSGCPANYPGWIFLGKVTIISKGRWVQARINFTAPPGINVLTIGPDCSMLKPLIDLADSTTLLDYYVYDLDDLHLLSTKDFHFPRVQNMTGDPCTADTMLIAPAIANAGYQWYKDSITIRGATQKNYFLSGNAPGNYNVRVINGDSCFTTEPFSFGLSELPGLRIPADTSLCENDSLLLAPVLKNITYTLNGNNTSLVRVSGEGIYKIIASDNNGCTSRFTVNVHIQNCITYLPNIFTPNGDGKNDIFRIPPDVHIQLEDFSVYDRWGLRVFNTTASNIGWNGTFKGTYSMAGTYVYVIRGMVSNKRKVLKGKVTLIR